MSVSGKGWKIESESSRRMVPRGDRKSTARVGRATHAFCVSPAFDAAGEGMEKIRVAPEKKRTQVGGNLI